MKKVLYITNIPSPYKIDFLNQLGKSTNLTAIFEARSASNQGIRFNYNLDEIKNFQAIFLSEGDIREKKIDWSILHYMRDMHYEEIILTSYSYFTEMIALLYLKCRKVPYYLSSDGGIIKKEKYIKYLYKKMLISGAKGYFSPSTYSDDYLVHYGAKRDKIHRYPFTSMLAEEIQNEILTSEQKKSYRKEFNISDNFVVLGVGQLVHRKGWDVLISAAQRTNKSIEYYIVGGGYLYR